MPKKKATKAKSRKSAATKRKSPAKKTGKKLSALDAAAKVLATAREPLGATALVEAMAAKGYWKSPGGKTPQATLHAALVREINTKGRESRFKKVNRGKFTLA